MMINVCGYYGYQADFEVIIGFENGVYYESKTVWNTGLEYLLR